MEYRWGQPRDWDGIAALLESTGMFNPVEPASLGGHWLVAEADDGSIAGTIWLFAERPHVFVDFWAARHPITAVKLGGILEEWCKRTGHTRVHGIVAAEKEAVQKLVERGFGCYTDGPYLRVYKEIMVNGPEENNNHDNDPVAERTGTAVS